MPLALRDTTYGCVSNARAALLDLETSTYMCLPEDLEPAVQKLLAGATLSVADEAALVDLVDEGILVETTSPRPHGQVSVQPPLQHIPVEEAPAPPLSVALAFAYQIAAAAALTFSPLTRVVAKQRARTRRLPTRALEANLPALIKIAKAFDASERLLPSNNKCLRRSLAMAAYLAHRGIAANLVIAVKMRPFAAHAWTQVGDIIINDHIDNVRPFTPILAV